MMQKQELKEELIKFFDWYKKSPFSSSGKTEDLVDTYFGDWQPTATVVKDLSKCLRVWDEGNHGVHRCKICGKFNA